MKVTDFLKITCEKDIEKNSIKLFFKIRNISVPNNYTLVTIISIICLNFMFFNFVYNASNYFLSLPPNL